MREYKSSLAPYIVGLIKLKRACGYGYDSQARILESFDRFCIEQHHTADTITRELLMQWAIQRPSEGKNHRNARVSFVRQLALYMQSLGKNAYIPKHFASETVDVPHLFSKEELTSFFAAVDAYVPPRANLHRLAVTYRVLFRLFYCCGLRLSEGCNLRRSCVDLQKGTITILQSKGNKDRLVFLSDDVRAMCKDYDEAIQKIVPDRKWFFPGWYPDRPIQGPSVDARFAKFWKQTPFAAKVDKKPTVQGLRHLFVVNKMNEWIKAGVDIGVMMPYLSRYLGHSSVSHSQYYFHTIEQIFPAVRRSDVVAQRVIPEVVPYEE